MGSYWLRFAKKVSRLVQSVKAVYLLFLKVLDQKDVEIGALGSIKFDPGTYVYVGSAMNSVEKRLERHFSEVENTHWHIDYLTAEIEPFDYFILPEGSEYEEWLAEKLEKYCEPVQGFGSSDSDQGSHLFVIPEPLPGSSSPEDF